MHGGVRRKKTRNGFSIPGGIYPGRCLGAGRCCACGGCSARGEPGESVAPYSGKKPPLEVRAKGVGAARPETFHQMDAIGFVAVACPCIPPALRLLDAAQHLLTPLRFCPIVIFVRVMAVWGAVGSPAQALAV